MITDEKTQEKRRKAIKESREFDLSEKIIPFAYKRKGDAVCKEDVKEFIEILEKYVSDARMYADMDEQEFWETSTINPQEAGLRAKYLEEFLEFIKEKAGDKLK